jgi:NAD(P)-dependent dehydrogenase (short-subunit alcohol dehydrogenase family)
MKLAGKVLVVTGADSGICRAVTLESVRRGTRVAAVDLNATTLEETATMADGPVSTHTSIGAGSPYSPIVVRRPERRRALQAR